MSKEVIVIAGANGSGKTTFARSFESEYPFKFINADEIAKKIDPNNIDRVKVQAGKEFFQQVSYCINTGENFILESTLSGRSLSGLLRRLKEKKYFIKIAYIFLENPDLCIERIKERVLKGGHFVPDEDVVRRFYRSKENFWNVYRQLSDKWYLFYNSQQQFIEIAVGSGENFSVNSENHFSQFISGIKEKDNEVDKFDDIELYQEAWEFQRIGNKGVERALKENKERGIPIVFSRNGIIYYELANGEITTQSPFEQASKGTV